MLKIMLFIFRASKKRPIIVKRAAPVIVATQNLGLKASTSSRNHRPCQRQTLAAAYSVWKGNRDFYLDEKALKSMMVA